MTMMVAGYDRYGGSEVVRVREEPLPEPGRGELLVRVKAAGLNPKDILLQSGRNRLYRILAGTRFPKRIGYDWSGEVVSSGPGVTDFVVGESVLGMINDWAGGACATHAVVRVDELARKPSTLSFEQAAALPLAGQTALQALRDVGGLQRGARVLINGASGGVGTLAVQIAKALGASVTATTSARNLELVKSLGADEVVDYAATELSNLGAGAFDVFFDVFGNRSFALARPLLTTRGVFVSTVPKPHVLRAHALTLIGARKRARLVSVKSRAKDLETLCKWADEGILTPVIDSVFPLSDIAQAEARVASKHARGKVVLLPTSA